MFPASLGTTRQLSKTPAIEAGGGWVRRGGAFSRASGSIWVAWPRPAVGGL